MKDSPISVSAGRNWRQILAAYQKPVLWRSILEIVITAAPLIAIWVGAWFAVAFGLWWLGLALAPLAAAFLVRLFMVQHDCSHQAFFKSAAANNWTGRIVGALTLTPYHCWRRSHAIHHASSGNLDRRGLGDIKTLTTAEYQALGFWKRLGYRAFRHPLVLFVIGPAWVFLIEQRLPSGLMREGWKPWVSAMGTNLVVGLIVIAVIWLGGWKGLLLIHLPTLVIAASIGVWLFYVQHQFEETYWARHHDWEPVDAALQGSSYYDLPAPLRWFTANIGVHHVHHVSARIPFYQLGRVLKENPELRGVSRLTLGQSLRCIPLSLWDEEEKRLVSFRQFNRKQRALAMA